MMIIQIEHLAGSVYCPYRGWHLDEYAQGAVQELTNQGLDITLRTFCIGDCVVVAKPERLPETMSIFDAAGRWTVVAMDCVERTVEVRRQSSTLVLPFDMVKML